MTSIIRKAAARAFVQFCRVWDSSVVVAASVVTLVWDNKTSEVCGVQRIRRAREVAEAAEWVRGEPAQLKQRKPPEPAFRMTTDAEIAAAGALAVPPAPVVYRQLIKRDPVVTTSGRTTDSTTPSDRATPRFGV